MTPQERIAALNTMYEAMTGRKIERIRRMASILHCKENTIRIYLMAKPSRVIPESKLRILMDAIQGQESS